MFVGRQHYFRALGAELEKVRTGGEGDFVLVRGRRQVGKSRMLTEFLATNDAPFVYYQATRKTPEQELLAFTETVAASTLACADQVRAGLVFKGWGAAFALIARTADRRRSPIVVIDELPYLMDGDPDFEATLQKAWDHDLERSPVLLIVVGSDLAMMRALVTYGRPLYGRPRRELTVAPLSPREVGELRGLSAEDALDAYLVTGGFPLVALSWPRGANLAGFVSDAFADPASPLVVVGERMVNAELPGDLNARAVLTAIGAGERAFTQIANAAGFGGTSLHRALTTLKRKDVIARDVPMSAMPQKKSDRIRIADPYLRFWLRFVEPSLPDVERGRADLATARFWGSWDSYRGRAIEPVVRDAIERILPDARFGAARVVGGYWTRANDPEVDLVGVADASAIERVEFAGSIRWRERKKFGISDARDLAAVRPRIPGAGVDTRLVAVSRTGFEVDVTRGKLVDVRLGPREVVAAFAHQVPR